MSCRDDFIHKNKIVVENYVCNMLIKGELKVDNNQ